MKLINRYWKLFAKILTDIQESEARYLNKSILLKESPNPVLYKALIKVVSFLVVTFFLWASLMQIEEVASTRGEIVPSNQLQNIQHPNGGVIKEILVEDGEFVKKDQVLMRLDPVSSASVLGQSKVQMENFLLQKERLETFISYATIYAENDRIKRALNPSAFKHKTLIEGARKCGESVPDGVEFGIVAATASGRVNLRQGSGKKYKVLGQVASGEDVLILEHRDEWEKVVGAQCQVGWLYAPLVTMNYESMQLDFVERVKKCGEPIPHDGEVAQVGVVNVKKTAKANLRNGIGKDGEVIHQLASGENVLILDHSGQWAEVIESGCKTGWIYDGLLDIKEIRIPKTGTKPLPTRPDFSKIPDVNPKFIEEQERIYDQQVKSYHSNVLVILHQRNQLEEGLSSLQKNEATLKAQYELWSKEYQIKEGLYKQGIFSKVELLQIERKVGEIKGELTQMKPQMNKVNEEINELNEKLEQYNADLMKANSTELSDVNNRIGQLEEILKRDTQEFQQLNIKSPVDGIVHGMKQHTLGGVVKPSETIMFVVPSGQELVADVRISSLDIGHVVVGQSAVLKFTTYTFDKYGGIKGHLKEVSPSTYKDENTGEPYYSATIVLDKDYVGDNPDLHKVMPGMTVQADIKTGGKTLLQYLISPLQKAATEGMRER